MIKQSNGFVFIIKQLLVFSLVFTLTACMKPQSLSMNERYRQARHNLTALFHNKSHAPMRLSYHEALARSVKHNLDYRIKMVNTALQVGQLDVAVFTMFPNLNTTASAYNRSNDYQVSGIGADGVESGLSSSTPRNLRTTRIPVNWNVLDFAMGYVKAKQQGNRVLIAYEESRRQLQQLGQDVLVAYWVAYSAQQLMDDTKEFQEILSRSKNTLNIAMHDDLVPKESILNYQASLLEGDRRLIQLKYKYEKAMLDLKHLLFLPVDQKIILEKPPEELFYRQDLHALSLKKLDAVTLTNHPQLQGQAYQQRIAKFGLKTVVLQALPGITLNKGWNYDSNQFLLNNMWLDQSADVAWNLLNLVSLPANYRTAKMQVQFENLKAMAMTMAALTENRFAYARYITLSEEYQLAQKQTVNAEALYQLNREREAASLASSQQVITAKLKLITSKMDENLLLSDLSVAMGELYLSVGVDIVPESIMYKPLPQAVSILKARLRNNRNFVEFINHKYHCIFTAYSVRHARQQAAAKPRWWANFFRRR